MPHLSLRSGRSPQRSTCRPLVRLALPLAAAALLAAACTGDDRSAGDGAGEQAESEGDKAEVTRAPNVQPPDDAPYQESPWWPYLSAHVDDEDPKEVVGGPIEIAWLSAYCHQE